MRISQQKTEVKVPVMMQMDSLECGAVCVAMVLAYYGKWLTMAEVRSACGISRDGSSGKNLLAAVRNYGMVGKGRRVQTIDLKEVTIPCILHYNGNHFVVFCGYRGDKAVINDPARGRILVPMDEFNHCFSGLLMQCSPGEHFVKEGKRPHHYDFIIKLMSAYKKEVAFLLLAGLAATVIGIITPALNQIYLDQAIANGNASIGYTMTILLLIMFTLQVVLTVTDLLTKYRINRRVAMDSNHSFFEHMLTLNMDFFSKHMTGDLIGRQKSNETISQGIIQQLAPILQQLATIILYIMIMLMYESGLAMIGIATSIISLFVSLYISDKQIDIAKAQIQHQADARSYSMVGLKSIESIKAGGVEHGYYAHWANLQTAYNNQSVKIASANAWLVVLPQFMQMTSVALISVLGADLIIKGEFTIGALVAFQAFLTAFYTPVSSLIKVTRQIQQMQVQIERVEDVMHAPTDCMEQCDNTYKLLDISGTIHVENLVFGYGRLQPPVIQGISFDVPEGASLGITGGSGCGKSTLFGVLLGLYPRWEGTIEYGGTELNCISRSRFTGYISIVRQTPTMFMGTVRDNLKMWDSDLSDEDMIQAAKDALIHDEIVQREGGYDSIVMAQGTNFSGGQRQKLEIARALVRNPKILFLDEATSALDAITEERIINNIRKRKLTSVVIAHRLSAIRDCDQILVMNQGRIVQSGTHEQLIAQSGIYHQLVEREKND